MLTFSWELPVQAIRKAEELESFAQRLRETEGTEEERVAAEAAAAAAASERVEAEAASQVAAPPES